jgi:RNA polymerase sigma factor (sigma-70 family)
MDAEDIVADVMLSVVSRLDTAGPVENITAYVYRSIRNKIADYERNRVRVVHLEDLADENGELPLLSMLSTSDLHPMERQENLRRLTDAIDRLEPRQRAVLIATELRGKSFRELSEEWDEPIGTLLSRKSRAVKTLKRILEDKSTEL